MGASCSKGAALAVLPEFGAAAAAWTPPPLSALPSDLAAALERLQAAPGAAEANSLLDDCSAALTALTKLTDATQLAAAAHGLGACIDAVLRPHMAALEKAPARRAAPTVPADAARAVGRLATHLHALHQRSSPAVPPAAFEVATLNQLFYALRAALFAQVVVETEDTLRAKQKTALALPTALGWPLAALPCALDAASKDLLLYLDLSLARGGERKVPLAVARPTAFVDALRQLEAAALLPAVNSEAFAYSAMRDEPMVHPSKGGACKLLPRFIDARVAKRFEGGEGHGPRRELFALLGQQMTGQQAGAPQLFAYVKESGVFWLRSGLVPSPALRSAFAFAGWLLAAAIVNRVSLGVPLAPALFKKLLAGPEWAPTIEELRELDPAAAAGVRKARWVTAIAICIVYRLRVTATCASLAVAALKGGHEAS